MNAEIGAALSPLNLDPATETQLLALIEPVAATGFDAQEDTLETVRIQYDGAGNMVVASSRKIGNLRFKLVDVLIATISTAKSASGSLEQPGWLVFKGLSFLWSLRKMAGLDIKEEDADVLLAIFRLQQEGVTATHEGVLPLLGAEWDEGRLVRALVRLEKLGCIGLGVNQIVLHEAIMVQGQER